MQQAKKNKNKTDGRLVRNGCRVDVNFQAPRVHRNYQLNQFSLWVLLYYLAKEKSVLFLQSVLNLLQYKRGHEEKNSAWTARCSTLMAEDLATKMDLALSKLDKLDTIEKRLNSVIASISSIEETVGRLDKEVVSLKDKTSKTETRVNELEEGARFNDLELSDVKRDTKKAQFDTEELRKQLLYLEAYSRRENLKFARISENVPEGQQMENTKKLVYGFREKELKNCQAA